MRRKLIALTVAVATVAVAAGIAWAMLGTIHLPGHGSASNPIAGAWDTTVAPTSSDSAGQADPTTFGMSPSRGNSDVGVTTVSYTSGALTPSSSGFSAGYLYTVQGSVIPGTAPQLLQSVTLTDLSATTPGATPFVVGTDIAAGIDPADCGKALSATDHTFRIGIKFLTTPASPSTSYAYGLSLDFVDASTHAGANCNKWTAIP